jgi:Flp pilus assembly protein TadD
LQPGLYEAELNLGLSLVRTNDPTSALPHLRAAAEKRPKEFRPALALAQALYNTSQFPAAEAAFKNAIALDSRSAAAESGLAMSLIRQNRADDAAPHWHSSMRPITGPRRPSPSIVCSRTIRWRWSTWAFC